MTLHLIGIGYKKEHINPEMLEIIKNSKEVFLEYYTSFYQTDFDELKNYLGKRINIVDRVVIESQIEDKIINPAKNDEISLLVIGDPLVATTHTDLILRCKELDVKSKIYNNVSIANFITNTGLQFYKFGKITSIPFYNEKFMPRTPYMVFLENQKINAHSLFLLDLNPSNDVAYKGNIKYLKTHSALEFLLKIPQIMLEMDEIEEKDANLINGETKAVICSRLGFDDAKIIYSTIDKLIEYDKENTLKEPLCVIIPSKMHEIEEEYLNLFKLD